MFSNMQFYFTLIVPILIFKFLRDVSFEVATSRDKTQKRANLAIFWKRANQWWISQLHSVFEFVGRYVINLP